MFGDDVPNFSRGNTLPLQLRAGQVRKIGGDGDEQTSGSLRIEKQVAEFGRDVGGEFDAVSHEGAIVPEAGGNMAVARGLLGAGQICERSVADFERDRFDASHYSGRGVEG